MTAQALSFEQHCDELGPEKVVYVYDPHAGLRAIVVIDNTARGPAIGGARMVADINFDEVRRLARAMTLKCAAAGLPHGGCKAGIVADPRKADKERLIRAFGRAVRDLRDFMPGPDMGLDEQCMVWLREEGVRSFGLPRAQGGIPLAEIGATGFGLARCAESAATFCDLQLKGATLAVEGFGTVGRAAARFLSELGVKLVAASDSQGAVHDPAGIDVGALSEVKKRTGTVAGYAHGCKLPLAELLTVPCDILIPAARPDCIHAGNAAQIKARLIIQGANIPTTPEAETLLYNRGVLVVPDFIGNAGGVICAAVEIQGGTEREAMAASAQKIPENTKLVLNRSRESGQEPRRAAVEFAYERVRDAMRTNPLL